MNGEGPPSCGERETDILDDEDGHPAHDLHSVGQYRHDVLLRGPTQGQPQLPAVGRFREPWRGTSATFPFPFPSPRRWTQKAGREDYGRGKRDFVSRGAAIPIIRVTQPPPSSRRGTRHRPGFASSRWWRPSSTPIWPQRVTYEPGRRPPVPEVTARGNSREEEFAAITVDIDQSIDQLNQLIKDLDPTFVPLSSHSNSVKKADGNHVTRSAEHHGNGLTNRPIESNGTVLRNTFQPAVPPNDVRADRPQALSHQGNDVTGCPGFRPPGWGVAQDFLNSPVYTPDLPPCQQGGILFRNNSVGYRRQGEELDSRVAAGSDVVPSTPAFPVSPPTPYARDMSEFLHASGAYRTEQESRNCAENIGHFPMTSGNVNPTSCQRPAGAVSPSGPLPQTGSFSSGQSWPEGGCRTSQDSRLSPPQSHPIPLRDSSPGGAQRGGWYGFEDRDGPSPSSSAPGQGLLLLGPPLPEKRRVSEGDRSLRSASPCHSGFSSPHSGSASSLPFPNALPEPSTHARNTPSPILDLLDGKQATVKFVQDTSKFWYKPDISRDLAIAVLKDKEPGSFIVRDSHSFRGAYGLAMKVATPPSSALQQSKKGGDLSNELVRHFLIECTPKGVRLKGCPNEPYFGSLTALVCQHSITPLALPCKLIIPNTDPEDLRETPPLSVSNSAAELLKQGAACNVWFLGSMEMESLTGHQAIQKATSMTLEMDPPPTSTVVHFKVSAQGITLTDNQRKLFFRRHYAVGTVIFCALDPQERKWMRNSICSAKIFGFVARKSGSAMENVCHLFAEHDAEQPASAIVNFVSRVMIGSHKSK
ncbi:hypothetical protein SKAU_G00380540 [Synaphobranchus kaupii]|uniref:SH2 domain-containing protein n=1 Tax=Synaphobranchus kaupii TaxID=118154 RepID=A0A9Q1EDL6_SYNKA|nr:hypothetical protein SKAU_G00380540 [Synaphobranchus kaupii]